MSNTTTNKNKKKTIGLAVLGVAAMAAVSATAIHHGSARERFDQVRAHHDEDCARWKKTHAGDDSVCHPFDTGNTYKKLQWKQPLEHVKAAREKLDRQDEAGAVSDLRVALDGARDLDRHGTIIAQLFASKIMNEVLDIMDRRSDARNALPERSISALLEGWRFKSALHPLESERLFVSSVYLDGAAMPPIPARPFTSIVATDAVNEENAITERMEAAIRARDAKKCTEEGQKRTLTKDFAMTSEVLCTKLITVIRTDERVERTRLRSRTSHLTTQIPKRG